MAVTYAGIRDWVLALPGTREVFVERRYGWVRVDLTRVDAAELRQVVEEAWRRTAPKRVVKQYDSGE
jgi:hypothetical protein